MNSTDDAPMARIAARLRLAPHEIKAINVAYGRRFGQ
jgi:hypothetical protein